MNMLKNQLVIILAEKIKKQYRLLVSILFFAIGYILDSFIGKIHQSNGWKILSDTFYFLGIAMLILLLANFTRKNYGQEGEENMNKAIKFVFGIKTILLLLPTILFTLLMILYIIFR